MYAIPKINYLLSTWKLMHDDYIFVNLPTVWHNSTQQYRIQAWILSKSNAPATNPEWPVIMITEKKENSFPRSLQF